MRPKSRRAEVLDTLRFAAAVIVLLIEALVRLRTRGGVVRSTSTPGPR
jgi:hypothetical protein